MRPLRLAVLPLVATAVLAVAGCGSSSSKSETTQSGTVQTGTAETGTTGTTATSGSLGPSTPVNAAVIVNKLVQIGQSHGLSAEHAQDFARCVEKQLSDEGLKTFAQLQADMADLTTHFKVCFSKSQTG
jgi:hypothetical protein